MSHRERFVCLWRKAAWTQQHVPALRRRAPLGIIGELLVVIVLSFYASMTEGAVGASPEAIFRDEFIAALKKAETSFIVTVQGELALTVKGPGGNEFTAYLNNAYSQYEQAPEDKDAIFTDFISGFIETITRGNDEIRASNIVPVIKDRDWMENTRAALSAEGSTNLPEYVFEDYNEQWVILYAHDTPRNVQYLKPEDVTRLGLERKELRNLACKNLEAIIPDIELLGTNGLFVLSAGGVYESSLVLFDAIWTNGSISVRGDYVVAVPARDLLMITGTEETKAINVVRGFAKETVTNSPYYLTDDLFVYTNGAFRLYDR